MKYRPEIDGLRAIAVIPVILFHAGFETFSGGFVGVDVFFVISGYLITTILVNDIENERFSITHFYERRARRILPALFFIMLCCLPFAWAWMLPSQLKDFSESLFTVSLFISNLLFWLESGYFEAEAELKPLLHTWSLAVEEQYYLFFPIILYALWRFGKTRVFWIIAGLAALSLAYSEWSWRHTPSANFFLIPTRAWELFAGSITAFIVNKYGVRRQDSLAFIGLAAIFIAIFIFDANTPFPSLYALVPVVGVALIILFANQETYTAKLLGLKPFVGLGLISYSAYLWHQPIFAFARIRLEETSQVLMLSLCAISLLLALFSWKFIEQPFRGKAAVFPTRRSLFYAALMGMVAFSSLGYVGTIQGGFENRFTRLVEGDVNNTDYFQYVGENYVNCAPEAIARRSMSWNGVLRCKQSKNGKPDIVLLGDSHAEHLFLGVADAYPERNVGFYILNETVYLDTPAFKTIFDELLTNGLKQKIFLTMHYAWRFTTADDLYQGYSSTITALKAAGHDVTLVGDVPYYKVSAESCAYDMKARHLRTQCSMTIQDAAAQRRVYHDTLTKLSQDHAIAYIRIDEPLCDLSKCHMIKDGDILYRDRDHLNILGSKLIGKHLANLASSE